VERFWVAIGCAISKRRSAYFRGVKPGRYKLSDCLLVVFDWVSENKIRTNVERSYWRTFADSRALRRSRLSFGQ
jgi:hypothetical protein